MTAVTVQEAAGILSQKFLLQEGVAGVSHRGAGSELVVYVESPEVAERVPSTLMGHPVRTVVSGRFQALGLPPAPLGRTLAGVEGSKATRWRPAPGGCSIGHPMITAGTLASQVLDAATGAKLFLSNNHVIAASNSGRPGDPILQPGPADGGQDPADRFGFLERFVPLRQPPDTNLVDAAVGRPLEPDMLSGEILDLGFASGVEEASVGMRVAKSGRTSCHTEAAVTDVNATVKVYGYPWEYCIFEDQIIAGYLASPGDSGSLCVDPATGAAVGLVFAGSDEFTVVNKISNVTRLLNISFAPWAAAGFRMPALFLPAVLFGAAVLTVSWRSS